MFKLIRDNVPEIIKNSGAVCDYATAENDELYIGLLRAKLVEEVNEYLNGNNIEELADVMTVISALVEVSGVSKEDYQKIYQDKLTNKGGFTKRYIGFFADKTPDNHQAPEQQNR